MSKLFKRKKNISPNMVQFCFQANEDAMLFFPTREDMNRYLLDYRRRIPIYKLSMFRVEFYQEI